MVLATVTRGYRREFKIVEILLSYYCCLAKVSTGEYIVKELEEFIFKGLELE